jgi:hypothetical protein
MAPKLQKYQKKINCTDVSTSLMDIIKVTKLQIKSRYSGIMVGTPDPRHCLYTRMIIDDEGSNH